MRHLILSVFALAAIAAQASQSVEHEPAFEVASVKANKTDNPGGSFVLPPGRLTATNIPLKVVITNAYQLSFFQVIGGPDWVSTDRFDITAKAPDGAPLEQTRAMRAAAIAEAARARGGRVAIPPPPAPNEPVVCQMRVSGRGSAMLTYRAGNITMSALANALRPYVGREVVDKTGLTGDSISICSFPHRRRRARSMLASPSHRSMMPRRSLRRCRSSSASNWNPHVVRSR